jgi:hypothetical protein
MPGYTITALLMGTARVSVVDVYWMTKLSGWAR